MTQYLLDDRCCFYIHLGLHHLPALSKLASFISDNIREFSVWLDVWLNLHPVVTTLFVCVREANQTLLAPELAGKSNTEWDVRCSGIEIATGIGENRGITWVRSQRDSDDRSTDNGGDG